MSNKQLYEKENNINKPFFPVVRLEDIIDTISEKSIQWILNNYNHIYVEWKNDVVGTRLSVPTILRRNGLWITYNNGNKLITEYYIGNNTEIKDKHWKDDANWENYTNKLIDGTVEYRHLSESLKQLFNKGNITNFPDEEDLTSDGVALSFKDREYQPENFSGLGRVILRKNIVKVGEEYKNILTQSMINKENTIYEIRYDFDLNGSEITIPENCSISFDGGSISNGTLLGRSNNKQFNISNFGNDIQQSFDVIRNFNNNFIAIAIDKELNNNIPININRSNIAITSNKTLISENGLFLFEGNGYSNITISNIKAIIKEGYFVKIVCQNDDILYDISNVNISNCSIQFDNNRYDGVYLLGILKNINISNNDFINSEKSEFIKTNDILNAIRFMIQDTPLYESNSYIENNNISNFSCSFDNWSTGYLSNVHIKNNNISNCYYGIRSYHIKNAVITNNNFDNCGSSYIWQSNICSGNIWNECGIDSNASVLLEAYSGNFNSNIIKKSKSSGVLFSSGYYGIFGNNLITESNDHGIYITAGEEYYKDPIISTQIVNNRIYKNKKHGIYCNPSLAIRDLYITNNIIIGNGREDSSYNSIHFTDDTSITLLCITDNIIANKDALYGADDSKIETNIRIGSVVRGYISKNLIKGINGVSVNTVTSSLDFSFNILNLSGYDITDSVNNIYSHLNVKDKENNTFGDDNVINANTVESNYIVADFKGYKKRHKLYSSNNNDGSCFLPFVNNKSLVYRMNTENTSYITIKINSVSEGNITITIDNEIFNIEVKSYDTIQSVINKILNINSINYSVAKESSNTVSFLYNAFEKHTINLNIEGLDYSVSKSYDGANNYVCRADGYIFSERVGDSPTNINAELKKVSAYTSNQIGYRYFNIVDNKPYYFSKYDSAVKWVDAFGNPLGYKQEGSSSERPDVQIGTIYFDTSLNKPIWKSKNGWVDATGAEV